MATWYDRADLYDAWYGWDPAAERDFVLGAARLHGGARGIGDAVLEPFCGTGRLLRAMPHGRAVGLDRNEAMLMRARRRGCRVFRADAASFAVAPASFDLAFCLIDSFRHLLDDAAARAHLRCMARALRAGSIYVLGLDVTGDVPGGDVSVTTWTGARDGWTVRGSVGGLGDVDRGTRLETVRVAYRGDGPAEATAVVEAFMPMRVYARAEIVALVRDEGSFEIAAVHDHRADLTHPVALDRLAGSAFLLLRRRP